MAKTCALALIVKNEALVLERCVQSFQGCFDELVIVDTGSTDSTMVIAQRLGAKVHWFNWENDFAKARQFSFDMCESDFILWADADDILRDGDAKKIRWLLEKDLVDIHRFPWMVRDYTVERERLVRRGSGAWHRAIHEEFRPNPSAKIGRVRDVVIIHSPLGYKEESHGRNIELLKKSTAETPRDLFYLATEYHRQGNNHLATKTAKAALALGVPDIEAYELHMLISIGAASREEIEHHAFQAYSIMPTRREALVRLTQLAMMEGRNKQALGFAYSYMGLPLPKDDIWTLQRRWYLWDGVDLYLSALRRNKLWDAASSAELNSRGNKTPTFSLIHATRGRPQKMLECRELWFARAANPLMVQHIFCCDADDTEVCRIASDYSHAFVEPGGGCVAAWNAGASISSGKVLIQLSDDWIPPYHWDKILLERIGDRLEEEVAVSVSDGIDRGGGEVTDCMCLAIMTRARYEFQGHMFFSGYKSVYSDNEFSDRAYADGIVINARDVVFEHTHPITGKVAMDATYKAQNAPERYNEGANTYLARKNKPEGLDRQYAAFILAAKDDLCLWDVIERLTEEGVSTVFVGVPDEYWNGKSNESNLDEVVRICDLTDAMLIPLSVAKHREEGKDILLVEAAVRNEALNVIRQAGFDHVLVADGDELWKRGTLKLIDQYISDNSPRSLNCRMIPVAGLPGYPIEGAQDSAMIYLGPGCKFSTCRNAEGDPLMFPRRQIYHFTATRRTMAEIIQKHRESGHYTDKNYQFEDWFINTLPNIKPGMKDAHMFTLWSTWPLVREWTQAEWKEIPDSIKPYLGAPNGN